MAIHPLILTDAVKRSSKTAAQQCRYYEADNIFVYMVETYINGNIFVSRKLYRELNRDARRDFTDSSLSGVESTYWREMLKQTTQNDSDIRTITRIYDPLRLAELSAAARDTAYNEWLRTSEYGWDSDNRNMLEALESVFKVKVNDWSYDACRYSYRLTSCYSGEEEELSGIWLLKYIVNSYWHTLFKPRTYYLKGNYNKGHKSRVFTDNCCVLTGYYADGDTLRPIYDFLKAPDTRTILCDLMDKCPDSFLKSCRDDMELQCSEESFEESCATNDYKLLGNRKTYN